MYSVTSMVYCCDVLVCDKVSWHWSIVVAASFHFLWVWDFLLAFVLRYVLSVEAAHISQDICCCHCKTSKTFSCSPTSLHFSSLTGLSTHPRCADGSCIWSVRQLTHQLLVITCRSVFSWFFKNISQIYVHWWNCVESIGGRGFGPYADCPVAHLHVRQYSN